jgi:hypothetical protein
LRALLQPDKGRDLFDLAHALTVFEELDAAKVIEYFQRYLQKAELRVSRADAEQRMFAKLRNPCRHATAACLDSSGGTHGRGCEQRFCRCFYRIRYKASGRTLGQNRRDDEPNWSYAPLETMTRPRMTNDNQIVAVC